MESEFINEIREILLTDKYNILAKMQGNTENFKKGVLDKRGDSADLATDVGNLYQMQALSAIDSSNLKAIDNALERINNNRYGICLLCNKKIPKERLLAMPSAVLCVECKSLQEKRR